MTRKMLMEEKDLRHWVSDNSGFDNERLGNRLITALVRAIKSDTIKNDLPAPLMGVNRSRILKELGVSNIDDGIKEIRRLKGND